jgi:hypothetical protein
MHRLAVVSVLAVGLIVGGTSTAGAVPLKKLNQQVTGSFDGTSTFTFNAGGCEFADQIFEGTYSTAEGVGSFSIEGCSLLVPQGTPVLAEFSGTFRLTTPDGSQITGTAAGSISTSAALDFTLTITGATGKHFRRAGGTIELDGAWFSSATAGVPGPIEGTLVGHLTKGTSP